MAPKKDWQSSMPENVEDEERLLPSDVAQPAAKAPATSRSFLAWAIVLLFLTFSLISNIILIRVPSLDRVCADYTSQYSSPMLDEVDIRYSTVQFDGTFMNLSIYAQPPGSGVDEAWLALGTNYRQVIVPENRAKAAGLSPGQNLLRQSSHWYYEHYKEQGEGAFVNDEEIVLIHYGKFDPDPTA
ncbi:hypothetical protein CLCR_06240 [Cladophialophora carrionii]|uniref:Uncharacterized protein n=1 Tax=Cladophialophora carrionii TaxID=86049 RepID=A0A1C1CA98_9EURO|nr:hypothetical protein CLCR_06240 [Cladophialophora carrionii]